MACFGVGGRGGGRGLPSTLRGMVSGDPKGASRVGVPGRPQQSATSGRAGGPTAAKEVDTPWGKVKRGRGSEVSPLKILKLEDFGPPPPASVGRRPPTATGKIGRPGPATDLRIAHARSLPRKKEYTGRYSWGHGRLQATVCSTGGARCSGGVRSVQGTQHADACPAFLGSVPSPATLMHATLVHGEP